MNQRDVWEGTFGNLFQHCTLKIYHSKVALISKSIDTIRETTSLLLGHLSQVSEFPYGDGIRSEFTIRVGINLIEVFVVFVRTIIQFCNCNFI